MNFILFDSTQLHATSYRLRERPRASCSFVAQSRREHRSNRQPRVCVLWIEWVYGDIDRVRILFGCVIVAIHHFISPHVKVTCPLFACWLTPKRNSTLLTTTSEFLAFYNIESNANLCIFVPADKERFIWPRVRATPKLFTGLLKWDIMCQFDFFIVRDVLWFETFYNIFIIFLRVAPIFTSRINSGTHKFNYYFSKWSVRFNLASCRFKSGQPIHGAAAQGRTDALLMLIAWGATGNERVNEGSVFDVL